MATIKYTLHTGAPGPEPGVYQTCLSAPTSHKYMAPRWWDGETWWDISWSAYAASNRGKKSMAFVWPKGAAANGNKPPKDFWGKAVKNFTLRKITKQADVRWGQPHKHYDEKEVLAWLVFKNQLPADWKECYQSKIREWFATK